MHVRLVQRTDIPSLATVSTAAFIDDSFTNFLAPNRREYPEAWRRYTIDRLHKRFITPGTWGIACVESSSTGDEEIMGCAFWQRQTTIDYPFPPSRYLCNNKDLFSQFELLLWVIGDKYRETFRNNPAMSREALKTAFGGPPPLDGFATIPDKWYLAFLAVSPLHQRKGVGRMLVNWGLDRCREEAKWQADGKTLPAGLIASSAGHELYLAMGFRVSIWVGEALNLAGIGGGASMVWDEDNTWVRPIREDEGVVIKGGQPVQVIYRHTEDEEVVQKAKVSGKDGANNEAKRVVFLVDKEEEMAVAAAAIRNVAA